jgi:two-component system, NtrC family, response regulator HydG
VQRPRSILIVDDDEEICDLLSFEFKRRGWRPEVSHDGESAWARLAQGPVDVVVSDVKMPVADGLSLLARVGVLGARPVFILISGYSEIESSDTRARAADAVLTKPFDLEELVQAIDRSLSVRSSAGGGA